MPVTQRQLLNFADQHAKEKEDEAALRAAVSRAYYAGFHASEFFHGNLESKGENAPPDRPLGLHEKLIYQLMHPTIPSNDPEHTTSRRLGIMCRDIKRRREMADYHLDATVTEDDAEYTCTQAETMLGIVSL